jgi:GAF domain-containing protein
MPPGEAAGGSIKISILDSMAGWVALNRTAVVCPDVKQDPRWAPIPGLDEEARSAILAPIMDNERLLGVLSVTHRQVNAFSEDHLDLLQVIAWRVWSNYYPQGCCCWMIITAC